MTKAIIGKKIGMTQIFDEAGKVVPVTVIEAGPCVVVQKKTTENDGYEAVQLGFGDVTPKHLNKPEQGHFKKNDVAFKKTLKEFRLDDISAVNVGDVLKADVFAEGDVIDVAGVSKVPSSVTTSTDSRRPTVLVLLLDRQAPWAHAPARPESSRARAWQVTWVLRTLLFRTW